MKPLPIIIISVIILFLWILSKDENSKIERDWDQERKKFKNKF